MARPVVPVGQRHGQKLCANSRLTRASVVEVLDDLGGTRPLVRRDDEVDVASPEAIRRVIGDTARVEAHVTKLIPPGQGSALLLERADGLPAVEPRVADRNRRVPCSSSEARDPHTASVRIGPAGLGPGSGFTAGLPPLPLALDRPWSHVALALLRSAKRSAYSADASEGRSVQTPQLLGIPLLPRTTPRDARRPR